VILSGKCQIYFVDSEMNELAGENVCHNVNVTFYSLDQPWSRFEDSLGCSDNVSLEFDGTKIPGSDFKVYRGYYLR